jgi:hypothetical protein
MAVALCALFVALGGASYALTLPRDSVGPRQLRARAVTSTKLGTGAVTVRALRDGAVSGRKIASGSVRASDLGGGSVRTAALANGAVTQPSSHRIPSPPLSSASRLLPSRRSPRCCPPTSPGFV